MADQPKIRPIDRRDFGKFVLGTMAMGCATQSSAATRMPVVFVGHGSPLNAIHDNYWSREFRVLGALLPKPRAIVSVSAHWYVDGTFVTAQEKPPTIHDFVGFPKQLQEMEYPAPGDPVLAKRVGALVGDGDRLKSDWGLDHGTWCVLACTHPKADIPVVQLSIDRRATPTEHHELGRQLGELRNEGVLVLCSGNITHNLQDAGERARRQETTMADYAVRFDKTVATVLEQRDSKALIALSETKDGKLAHPTLDHWLPLLYAQAASGQGDKVSFPVVGFSGTSLSMRAVRFG